MNVADEGEFKHLFTEMTGQFPNLTIGPHVLVSYWRSLQCHDFSFPVVEKAFRRAVDNAKDGFFPPTPNVIELAKKFEKDAEVKQLRAQQVPLLPAPEPEKPLAEGHWSELYERWKHLENSNERMDPGERAKMFHDFRETLEKAPLCGVGKVARERFQVTTEEFLARCICGLSEDNPCWKCQGRPNAMCVCGDPSEFHREDGVGACGVCGGGRHAGCEKFRKAER